jgi:hypothetical protein
VTDTAAPERTPRASASADASRTAELQRIRAMSPLERMALALALGRRCKTVAALAREASLSRHE